MPILKTQDLTHTPSGHGRERAMCDVEEDSVGVDVTPVITKSILWKLRTEEVYKAQIEGHLRDYPQTMESEVGSSR